MNKNKKPLLIALQGPTAVGKSDLALSLAQSLNGYIISADSRQIYKGMKIGTAKPSDDELSLVSHFLVGEIDPRERFSAGEFVRRAKSIVADNVGRVPLLVGGTGFYIKAFLQGLNNIPEVIDDARAELSEIKNRYEKLCEVDPKIAAKVHSNDFSRIERALLVYFSCGKPLSSFWEEQVETDTDFRCVNILLERDRTELYSRIDKRFDTMMELGLLDEIKSLLERGYSWGTPGLNTVGYKEFEPYFAGKASLQVCVEKAKQDSRNFAKRQLTWYRKIKFDLTLSAEKNNLPTILSYIDNEFAM